MPFNVNMGGINRDVTLHISDKVHLTQPLYRGLNGPSGTLPGAQGTYINEAKAPFAGTPTIPPASIRSTKPAHLTWRRKPRTTTPPRRRFPAIPRLWMNRAMWC